MRRSRVTIDASVLAALIGIDRLVERNVGRGVVRDDGPRRLDGDCRLEWGTEWGTERRGLVVGDGIRGRDGPAVVVRLAALAAKAVQRIVGGTPATLRRLAGRAPKGI